jgi:hypothetical protein
MYLYALLFATDNVLCQTIPIVSYSSSFEESAFEAFTTFGASASTDGVVDLVEGKLFSGT